MSKTKDMVQDIGENGTLVVAIKTLLGIKTGDEVLLKSDCNNRPNNRVTAGGRIDKNV